ncbi:MAG: AAA family ATPase [Acidimicrobiales bacterium]|jgi:pilus assembly protein CpaE
MSGFLTDDSTEALAPSMEGEMSVPTPETLQQAPGFGANETTSSSNEAPAHAVNLVVIEPDGFARSRLITQLGANVSSFRQIEDLVPYLNGEPIVLVLGPSCAIDDSLVGVERVLQAHREIGSILVTEELTTNLLQQALRSGVKDVLAFPADDTQMSEAIDRVAASLATTPSSPVGDDPLFEGDGELAQVITLFSTKGGSGKSVIASNLGVILAQRSEKPVVLIDADLQFGDIAVMLKLVPQHTIVDVVSSLDRLDVSLMQSLLVRHESSGLLILPAPLEPAFADQVGAAELIQIVDVLRSFCSYVIIDTPAYFNDVVLGMIEVSDDVLLVAGMDIPSVKNLKIGLQTLRLLNTPVEKLRLILIRANSKVRLDVAEVERTLQVSADILVPSDIVVPQSVHRGVPVVHSAPRSGVAKSLQELASLFLPVVTSGRRKK